VDGTLILQSTAVISTVTALLTAVANVIALRINWRNIRNQSEAAKDAAKRDARAKISEAYQRFNAITLTNDKAFSSARQFMWGQIRSDERVAHHIFFTLLLNTIYEEFHFVKAGLADHAGYLSTVETWSRIIARSNEHHDATEFLRFLDIVQDFPLELREDFKKAVMKYAKT